MASIDENKRYLGQHLSYEISMLACALNMLVDCNPGPRSSMYFECFAVHARNCRVFLINEDGNNYKAKDYNKKFEASNKSATDKEALKLITRLGTRVFHLAKNDRDKERITVGDAVKMYDWIVKELERFGDELPATYKSAWSGSITVQQRRVRPIDSGAQATNYYTNTTFFTPGEALSRRAKLKLSGDAFVLS